MKRARPPVAGTASRWRPSPLIGAVIVLHAAALLVLLADPASWRFPLALILALQALIFILTLIPRSALLGPNLTRLPMAAVLRKEVVLSFDDGPDPSVTPVVLALLERYGVRASFFCVAQRAAAHPQLLAAIVHGGHSVENHSEGHSNLFAFKGYFSLRGEVDRAQQTLTALAGQAPAWFRAPMGIRNPFLDPVLARAGLRYVSWTRRGFDAVRGDADAVLRRLSRRLAAGDILLLHDGHAALTADGQPVVLAVLPRLLEQLAAAGLRGVSLPMAMRA